MAKTQKSSPKSDKLKTLKAEKKAPLSVATNGSLTTDELADKLHRDLVIRYVAVDSETDFLILNADDNNKSLPKEMEKDTFKTPVHPKLKDSLQLLRVHAAILVNYIDAGSIKKISDVPDSKLEDFNITSVHFKYGKKGDSIQINATLRTQRDKAFNFTTPIEYLNSESESAYEFSDDLIKIRQDIFDRINKYMTGEERGDVNAVGMFKETENGNPMTAGKEVDVTDLYIPSET